MPTLHTECYHTLIVAHCANKTLVENDQEFVKKIFGQTEVFKFQEACRESPGMWLKD